MSTRSKKKAMVWLIEDLKPELQADIRRKGVHRCAVLVPDCKNAPRIQVQKKSGMCHLACRRHAAEFCREAGISEPTYPEDVN
jgi:hypothetical protein